MSGIIRCLVTFIGSITTFESVSIAAISSLILIRTAFRLAIISKN